MIEMQETITRIPGLEIERGGNGEEAVVFTERAPDHRLKTETVIGGKVKHLKALRDILYAGVVMT
jgi:hypothetical protein